MPIKGKGTPVTEIFSIHVSADFPAEVCIWSLLTGKNTPNFAKSYLNRSRECNSLSCNAMTAHTRSCFHRYRDAVWKSRESNDNRSLGELFLYFSDEMSDITWIQAFQMLLQMFRTMLSDNTELSDEKINELANAFMDALPTMMKIRLQAA